MNLFAPDARKAAFVVIDMQNFSCMPVDSKPMPRIDVVIERINRLVGVCRENGVPVIWVRHNISSVGCSDDGGLFSRFHNRERIQAVMNLCQGTEIYREMDVDYSHDHVVFKNRYSAFLSNPPELRDKLEALGRTQLLIAGIAANVCVATALLKPVKYEDFDEPHASDGVLNQLMAKVKVVEDPEIDKAYPAKSKCVITATLTDGSTVQAERDYSKGDPNDPLSDKEIEEKLSDYFFFATSKAEQYEIIERLWNLEKEPSMDWLVAPLKRRLI